MSKSELVVTDECYEFNDHLILFDQIISGTSIPEVLKKAAGILCTRFNAERASIYLVKKETRELETVAIIGNVARNICVPIDKKSLAGYCGFLARFKYAFWKKYIILTSSLIYFLIERG